VKKEIEFGVFFGIFLNF